MTGSIVRAVNTRSMLLEHQLQWSSEETRRGKVVSYCGASDEPEHSTRM